MRIGISGYVGNKKTGIGRVLENVLKQVAILLPESEFILFVNKDFLEYIEIDWPNNVKIVQYNVSKNNPIGNIIWHQFGFQRQLKKFECDCEFLPNFSLLLWNRIPTVSIIHDMIEFNVAKKFNMFRVLYRRFAVPRMARKSDIIITVSNSSKSDIIKFCKIRDSKIKVAYNGCDFEVFKPYSENEVRKKLTKHTIEPYSYVMSVGTIDYPGKNVFSLVKAFFKAKKQFDSNLKLLIVGKSGHNAKKIFDLVSNSPFCNDVRFTGFVSDEDLPYFYSGALVFCFLSLYEGFGLPLLEAMACGCPVIASNTSSLPEVLGDAGITIDPFDIDGIAKAIWKLENSPFVQNESRMRGISRAKMFSWVSAAKVYCDVFNEIKNSSR